MKKHSLLIAFLMFSLPVFSQSRFDKLIIGNKAFGDDLVGNWTYARARIKKIGDSVVINGNQVNGRNFCKIKGTIKMLNARNFIFKGTIAVYFDNGYGMIDNKRLIGQYLFKRTGDRQYWRLQQPTETGTGLFDHIFHYIDIFIN